MTKDRNADAREVSGARTGRRALLRGVTATLAVAAGFGGGLGFGGRAWAQDAETIAAIGAYLNGVSTMDGTFVQIGPDGTVSEGLFRMRRPGRLRFEYTPPNPTVVIADGFWVAIIDEKDDETVDRYPLSETPLYLLLKEDVDFNAENAVRSIEQGDGQFRMEVVDPSGETQGSITLVFDQSPIQLRQWIVTDPQGLTTTVALRTVREGVTIDPAAFVIPDGGRGGKDG